MRVVAALLAAALAGSPLLGAAADDEPKLKLKRPAPRLMPPTAGGLRIEVSARLEGEIDDPEKYYCLTEVWDWGDGTESVYDRDCDPYEEGAEVKRDFVASHYYPRGVHEVTLYLKRNDETVIYGRTQVYIR